MQVFQESQRKRRILLTLTFLMILIHHSTFNIQYPNEAFKRLHDLMEFNTLNNLDVCMPVLKGLKESRLLKERNR